MQAGEGTDVPRWWTASFSDRVSERLTDLGIVGCPLCRHPQFHVGRDLIRVPWLLAIPVECAQCGYTALFNVDRYLDLADEDDVG